MRFRRTKRIFLSALIPLLALSSLGILAAPPQGVSAGDCDDNAVIRCGVTSINDLKAKCRANQQGNVQQVFRAFGIANCSTALDGLVQGTVRKDNKVYIGNKVVATNAVVSGRQNLPGSTPILGGAFYQRPPSVSFRQDSLAAYIKMNGDRFMYAILIDCGNPVRAVPVPKPPVPQASFSCQGLNVRQENRTTFRLTARGSAQNATITGYIFKINNEVKQDSSSNTYTFVSETPATYTATVQVKTDKGTTQVIPLCSAQFTVAQVTPPPPPPTPVPTPAPAPRPQILPDTGPGMVLGWFGLATGLGMVLYRLKEYYLVRLNS